MDNQSITIDHHGQFIFFRDTTEKEFSGLETYIHRSLAALDSQHSLFEEEVLGMASFFLKNSLFITTWSFLEHSLKKFCEVTTQRFPKYERRVSKYNRMYQYHSYFRNEMKLDVEKLKKEWENLDQYREIRNCIVHHHSTVRNTTPKTAAFIENDERFIFEAPDKFQIKDSTLILELLNISKSFLFTLLDEYKSKYLENI